jgi:hypothetical protein
MLYVQAKRKDTPMNELADILERVRQPEGEVRSLKSDLRHAEIAIERLQTDVLDHDYSIRSLS